MAAKEDPKHEADSKTVDPDLDLMDLFLYAPIGLLYDYQDIIPKLVKRGKSQVQVGLLLGKMAASKGQQEAEKQAGDLLAAITTIAARGITEFGQVIGMAPPEDPAPPVLKLAEIEPSKEKAASKSKTAAKATSASKATSGSKAKSSPKGKSAAKAEPTKLRLPIAGYDDLTAREIIVLLEELSPKQRERVRAHEAKNRRRKTVMAKLDALG